MSLLTWPTAAHPVDLRAPRTEPLPSGLSRNRGGTYSSTVETVRFHDGSTARTDLIRLNPNVDTYSLDATGASPRQISHYREAAWEELPVCDGLVSKLTRILAASVPFRSLRQVTHELRVAGYLPERVVLHEHEVIAGTQAAIWRLTNGLELDTRPLDAPVRAIVRLAPGAPARPVTPQPGGRLDWSTPLRAGRPAVLEVELAGAPELRGLTFTVGERTGRHPVTIRLEASEDGRDWTPVSGSRVVVTGTHTDVTVSRHLGPGATLSSATAHAGRQGFGHYRLIAEGPSDRDGLLDLHGLHFRVAAPSRFTNNERVVAVYRYLTEHALAATPSDPVLARALVGSRIPGGVAEFTPVVTLARVHRPAAVAQVAATTADAAGAGDPEWRSPFRPARISAIVGM